MPNGRVIRPHYSGRSHERLGGRHPDELISALAAVQHGRVARRQLLAAGLTRHEIDGRVASGHLIQEYTGVYAVGHRSEGWPGAWMAAVLAAGDDAALSFVSAAAHRGIVRWRPTAIDVTCPRALRPRSPLRFHRSRLASDEVEVVDSIPTTTVARTLFDLASVLGTARLELAINEAEVQGFTSPCSLPALLDRHPRRPGSGAIREILAANRLGQGSSDSELEDRFQILVVEESLPRPIRHASIELPSGTAVVDNLWLPQRVVLELDGNKYHRTAHRRRLDRARDRALTAGGYQPLRAGWYDVARPAELLADLRSLLGSDRRQ